MELLWPVRLSARTRGSQPRKRGSIPLRAILKEVVDMTNIEDADPEDFVNVETGTRGLKAIMDEAILNSIWETNTVEDEPEIILVQWQVFESPVGRHFTGYSDRGREGRVSSPIMTFDDESMKGITRSGRVYQLAGPSGFNADADYVLGQWLYMNEWTREDAEYVTI